LRSTAATRPSANRVRRMHYASDKKVSVSFANDKACSEPFVDCDVQSVISGRVLIE
jgi:hypothetical protein